MSCGSCLGLLIFIINFFSKSLTRNAKGNESFISCRKNFFFSKIILQTFFSLVFAPWVKTRKKRTSCHNLMFICFTLTRTLLSGTTMSWAHKSISENANEQSKLTTRQFHHAATRYEGEKAWEFIRKNVNKLARSLWKFCENFAVFVVW